MKRRQEREKILLNGRNREGRRNARLARLAALALSLLMLAVFAVSAYAAEGGAESSMNGYDRGYTDGKNGDGKLYAHGIDISVWQGENFNFDNVTAAGYSYVILRAGVTYEKDGAYVTEIDQYFESNYANAKAAGLDVGVYFYSMARTPEEAVAEADALLGYIDGRLLEYPVYMDFEAPAVRSYLEADGQRAKPICQAFMDRIAEAGYLAGMYSSASWIDSGDFNGWMGEEADELGEKYELWIACYYNDATYARRGAEYSERFGMYQYTSSKYISGYGGRLDANICFKDYPSIVKKYGFNGYEPDDSVTVGGEGLSEKCYFKLGKYTIDAASSKVELLSEPDIDAERAAYVSNRITVEAIDARTLWTVDWVKVLTEDGVSGWIKASSLAKYKEPKPTDSKPTDAPTDAAPTEAADTESAATEEARSQSGCGAALPTGALLSAIGSAGALTLRRIKKKRER